jgi:hypothetical protein
MSEIGAEIVSLGGEAIWGAKAIAAFAGVGIDTVYAWALDPAVPVYKPGGRYFAIRHELMAWLRSKPMKTPISPDLTY